MVEAKFFPKPVQPSPAQSSVAIVGSQESILKSNLATGGINPPPGFDVDPNTLDTQDKLIAFLKEFDDWSSEYQIMYAEKYGKDGVLLIPPMGHTERTIVTSATNPGKIYIVEEMDANAYYTLSREDQVHVAGTKAFEEAKGAFGFERAADVRFDDLPLNEYIDSVIEDMRAAQGKMPDADLQAFLDQLRHERDSVNAQEILRPSIISKRIEDIKASFKRAALFANVKPESYDTKSKSYSDVISLDGGAAISQGYRVFADCDRQIAQLEEQRSKLLKHSGKLDVPELLMQFLMLTKQINDTKSVREAEESKQQNELSKTYAAMQDAVNETLRLFNGNDEDQKYSLYGKNYADLTDRQKMIVSMFSTLYGAGAQQHPLEEAGGVARALMDMLSRSQGHLSMTAHTSAQWNTFGTQLSEGVTTLGRNTQLKTNEITSMQQMSTSLFEAISKTISNSYSLLQSVAKNIS